jgi:tetratricopeptide (TPR) repeat protein
VAFERGSGNEALIFADTALDIYATYGLGLDDSVYINALMARAQSLKLLNRVEEALQEIEKVTKFHRENGSRYLDDFLRTQSNWFGEIGQWEAALRCQVEAVTINEIDGNQEWLAISLFWAAHCHIKLGDYHSARDALTSAKRHFKALNHVGRVGDCDTLLSRCYLEMRAFEAGLAAGKRALTVARVAQDNHGQVRAELILMRIHIAMGNPTEAHPFFLDAEFLANLGSEKDWDLLAEVQEVSALMHRAEDAQELATDKDDRAATIREILG